ncbi:hypothetical protein Fmac_001543 [Flemingia macrophylla]|uniref:ATP synthase F0 subunit 8 n=1 Tax=Flemingia macrophylla TaxID=520843 RepID=A0ABD1NI48_9FABA
MQKLFIAINLHKYTNWTMMFTGFFFFLLVFFFQNLIDLAGPESSKNETTGLRRNEGSYINKSLQTLGTRGVTRLQYFCQWSSLVMKFCLHIKSLFLIYIFLSNFHVI